MKRKLNWQAIKNALRLYSVKLHRDPFPGDPHRHTIRGSHGWDSTWNPSEDTWRDVTTDMLIRAIRDAGDPPQ